MACPVDSCSIPTDVVIQSSDGQMFGAHAKNLEFFAEGFPLSDLVHSQPGERVELSESAEILKLFLAFTHNAPPPEIDRCDIDIVMGLAEAADKYGNHIAMAMCKRSMRALAEQGVEHALRILKFKAVYRDYDEIDYVAELTMSLPTIEAVKGFGSCLEVLRIWLLFQHAYNEHFQAYSDTLNISRSHIHDDSFTDAWGNTHERRTQCSELESFQEVLKSAISKFAKTRVPTIEHFQLAVSIAKFTVERTCDELDGFLGEIEQILLNRPKWSDLAKVPYE